MISAFIILSVLTIILLILILFLLVKRNDAGPVIPRISQLENIVKDEFRNNRSEFGAGAKETRLELSNSVKDFAADQRIKFNELKTDQRDATDKTLSDLEKIKNTLNEKLDSFAKKTSDDARQSRETLANAIKEFSFEQRLKFDDLKQEQTGLKNQTASELEKIRNKVEEKLEGLLGQAKNDNNEARENLKVSIRDFQESFNKNIESINSVQREKFVQLEDKQNKLVESTEKRLEEIRAAVEEKLQKTLTERLGISFDLVSKQLESVQKGLGEMQTLAQDVGGLKKVLSNVKMRGGFGEVQLSLLLEQILAPDQYEANVRTKVSSADSVEFAIKLPGRDDGSSVVWLPVDAKFPRDVYEQLQTAYDTADIGQLDTANKLFETTIRRMARSISEKYIDPPNTTDFAIMFLPFESIYSEVVRRASLLEELQRQYKIVVTGPTTLAAILNSFQMGFRTLVIQKRSSEVWKILGAVKKEFENFGGLLEKAQKNLQTASNQIDEVMGKRTRAIQRSLKGIEVLDADKSQLLLPDRVQLEDLDEEE